MLSPEQQKDAIAYTAAYFDHQTLKSAVQEAVDNGLFASELDILSGLINQTNLIRSGNNEGNLEVKNIMALEEDLPIPFSWSSRSERKRWTDSLIQTTGIINREIDDSYYRNPDELDRDSVFRFFLIDGYARWIPTTFSKSRNLEAHRDQANIVVNALCEAAVLKAVSGNLDAYLVVSWMNQHGWIDEKWGIDEAVVRKAKALPIES